MILPTLAQRLGRRLRDQSGFTLVVALGILTIVMLLTGALVFTVQSDAGLTRNDLDGKRAYAAAQAGAQAYLFNLNDSSSAQTWWQNCANDTGSGTVPGNSRESYTYKPVVACNASQPVGTVLDPTTGQLRMEFTGTSGAATRTIVVAYRTLSPLSYLWYTVYETEDPVLGGNSCARFYWQNPQPPSSCQIQWITGDVVNGPMYTQDDYLVNGTPRFGGSSTDSIASSAPTTHVCVGVQKDGSAGTEACPKGVLVGTEDPDAPYIPLPTDNSNLQSVAGSVTPSGVLTGTTTISITGTIATTFTCPTTTASDCSTQSYNLANNQVIYVKNASGCGSSYTPTDVPAPAAISASSTTNPYHKYNGYADGPCGDVYLQASTYSASLTIAAENDIIIQGDVTDQSTSNGTPTGTPTGTATLGLIADQYVRVSHPLTSGNYGGTCGAANTNRTIDAAILTLAHSFFVDNYECGTSNYGTLTVNGAIAQEYRGIVGQSGGNNDAGYLKNYSYDDRLSYLLPPYMFDLQNSAWQVVRETLCGSGLPSSNPKSCAYTGSTS